MVARSDYASRSLRYQVLLYDREQRIRRDDRTRGSRRHSVIRAIGFRILIDVLDLDWIGYIQTTLLDRRVLFLIPSSQNPSYLCPLPIDRSLRLPWLDISLRRLALYLSFIPFVSWLNPSNQDRIRASSFST